jgi:hypothetical protein
VVLRHSIHKASGNECAAPDEMDTEKTSGENEDAPTPKAGAGTIADTKATVVDIMVWSYSYIHLGVVLQLYTSVSRI